jgi:hypothetical protein
VLINGIVAGMPGRMIRVGGKKDAVLYAVAESRAVVAEEVIRSKIARGGEFVEDMGPVEDHLLSLLHLASGEFKRV